MNLEIINRIQNWCDENGWKLTVDGRNIEATRNSCCIWFSIAPLDTVEENWADFLDEVDGATRGCPAPRL
jgi:hypothetical protein